jgi:hypothetical protein
LAEVADTLMNRIRRNNEMAIERDRQIRFHELGTLQSVTRWISSHEEGLAEWLKNARRAYQSDRADVEEGQRVALLLFRDAGQNSYARIGLLDVGGATLEDVNAFSTWQDPEASGRGSQMSDETTQGNGGKAYMYRMFRGPARLLGLKERHRNCKGFEGPPDSLERGTPGFIPNDAMGREVPDCQWEHELQVALQPYNLRPDELPAPMQDALRARQAFTLVEGVDPPDIYRGRIDSQTLIERLLCHDQAVLAVQQLRVFAIHDGRPLCEGRPLQLEPIAPYPEFESERVFPIPEDLPSEEGRPISTTRNGTRPGGRLILRTSAENMHRAHFRLRARWRISYRTDRQMIGSKSIGELAPNSPGTYYIYGEVELAALDEYVDTGRIRPAGGPLVNALDRFIGDRIRDLAREINDRRRQERDEGQLDEIHEENRLLDRFKNRFLSSAGIGGAGGIGTSGEGGRTGPGGNDGYEYGTEAHSIQFTLSRTETLRFGRGVSVQLETVLRPRIKDADDRTVRGATLEWLTGDRHVAEVVDELLVAQGKGEAELWARVSGTGIESARVRVQVLNVDHVLLTPRNLEIPLGTRGRIVAEVTDDEGQRATDVYLQWSHDADDPMMVRISPLGSVFGNRVGQTCVLAGAGDRGQDGVWARIPVDVRVVPNEQRHRPGGGFPQLLVTGRDIDPETGDVRQGDPDRPSLNQEVSDYDHNIWWLNLDAPEATFFFQQRTENPQAWRGFHAQKLVEMVGQVRMREEATSRGREERPEVWAVHKARLEDLQVELMAQMWQAMQPYILTGQGLE